MALLALAAVSSAPAQAFGTVNSSAVTSAGAVAQPADPSAATVTAKPLRNPFPEPVQIDLKAHPSVPGGSVEAHPSAPDNGGGDNTNPDQRSPGGDTQTDTSSNTDRVPGGSTATSTQGPSTAGAVHRYCISRRSFRIHIRRSHRISLRRADVYVNGKLIKADRRKIVVWGTNLTAIVNLKLLPRDRITAKIVARTVSGKLLSGRRRYWTCSKKIKRVWAHNKHLL